eukprot:SAG11_NODE_1161_length_5638_cov_10.644545_4_plen_1446_part_01
MVHLSLPAAGADFIGIISPQRSTYFHVNQTITGMNRIKYLISNSDHMPLNRSTPRVLTDREKILLLLYCVCVCVCVCVCCFPICRFHMHHSRRIYAWIILLLPCIETFFPATVCDLISLNLTCTDFSFASDQFPILFFEECQSRMSITDRSKGDSTNAYWTVGGHADQILMGLFDDIDGGLNWGVNGDHCHSHSSGNNIMFNVQSYLGFVLYLAGQCCSMVVKKRRQGPSYVGDVSKTPWWSKEVSDKHRCWEALVERGPTETIHFHDRLIVLYMLVAIYLLPLVSIVHRNDASGVGIVVPGCFHLVLVAAVLAIGANVLMVDKFLQSELRQYEAQAWALGASEAHIEAVRRSNVPEQSVIELLHYLTRTYIQLRRAARRLGADECQIDSALTMDANSKKAAIILFLLQLRKYSICSNTEVTKNNGNGKVVNNGATKRRTQTQIFVRCVNNKTISVMIDDNEDLLAKVTNVDSLKSDEVWISHAGKPVISGCNSIDSGIQPGSTVTMIRRLCGGMLVASKGSALEPEPEPEPLEKSTNPVDRSVSLRWLLDFVAQNRGKRVSFERREFMVPEDGGGNEAGIDATAETLSSHRIKRRTSETAGTGQQVTVRYSDILFEAMTTADVMEAMIRPVCRSNHKSFAEAKIRLQATGPPTYFVSHAWDSLFVDLVESVAAFLEAAAQEETFAWLDIFAINQDDTGGTFSAMAELDDGRTLARVIELSRSTLVVLDKERVAPFTRLWCLYEIGSTPTSKLQLLTHGFSEKDISQHVWNIDAETALCFSPDDKKMIHEEITQRFGYGTLQRFTTELRLRLLLRPMSYAADLKALCDRAAPQETYNFDRVWQHVQAAAGRVVCVVGGAGEGKSTLAAMMLSDGDGDEDAVFIHAAHFCKRADTNRQDLGGIARSIGYQLAQRVDHSGGLLFGLTREEAEAMQTDSDAAVKLLIIRPLEGLAAAGRRVVLLIDALDEAQDQVLGTNRVVSLLQDFGKAKTNALSVVVTMRPDPGANLLILRRSFGLENVLELSPSTLQVASAVGGAAQSDDVLRSTPEWAMAMRVKEQSKIYVIVCRGFVEKWLACSRSAAKLPTPPESIDEAYKLWFELQPPTDGVKQLLGLVMAARQPLSSAHLDVLGLLAARDGLPGWGLLFEDRDHLLQTIHLSVREFLLDASRSGAHAADVASGHTLLASSCLKILQQRTTGPTLEYALRHGHVHLAEVLRNVTTKGTAVVHDWFQAFLQPRSGAEAVVAARNEPTTESVVEERRAEAHVQQNVAVPMHLWEKGKECYICRRKFSLRRRRHHCRACGRSCCDDHSARSVVLHGAEGESSEHRVCDICANQERGYQHSTTEFAAAATVDEPAVESDARNALVEPEVERSVAVGNQNETSVSGWWRQPNIEEAGEGETIIGRRVLVKGRGEGVVVSYARAKIGASSHVIKYASGDEAKVKLAR